MLDALRLLALATGTSRTSCCRNQKRHLRNLQGFPNPLTAGARQLLLLAPKWTDIRIHLWEQLNMPTLRPQSADIYTFLISRSSRNDRDVAHH
jgi:hypothetical protein